MTYLIRDTKPEFKGFPKIPRLNRECVFTEKIDGTNAQIIITHIGEVFAGSRNRFISVEDDNYGFAKWVEENKKDLLELGPGYHFGEWWGKGIQRGYGLDGRKFSLFNSSRWKKGENIPDCVDVVPELHTGSIFDLPDVIYMLKEHGSFAAKGFSRPEGVIVHHKAANTLFKVLLENDEGHKNDLLTSSD